MGDAPPRAPVGSGVDVRVQVEPVAKGARSLSWLVTALTLAAAILLALAALGLLAGDGPPMQDESASAAAARRASVDSSRRAGTASSGSASPSRTRLALRARSMILRRAIMATNVASSARSGSNRSGSVQISRNSAKPWSEPVPRDTYGLSEWPIV